MMLASRRHLLNGLLMSVSFAGLEGCVIASINLSAALLPPVLADRINAILFGCFAMGTFVAPAIVRRLGVKRSMVISMFVYSLYLFLFIWVQPVSLMIAACLGGLAGAVLWTAQGVYFTRNAVLYAAAVDPESGEAGESRAISVFAGMFAVCFQIITTLAKPFAALLLTLFPSDRQLLFGSFTTLATMCSAAMMLIKPLHTAGCAPSEAAADPANIPQRRSCYSTACSGDAVVLRMLLERRMLLLALYNVGYGMSTAFFPSQVTVLTKRSFESADSELAPAAVGWMYAAAGLTSALVAGLFAVGAYLSSAGRPVAMAVGSLAFMVPCSLLTGPAETDTQSVGMLLLLFICYGCGVAAWQGSCMALVGDLFKGQADSHRAGFAHLKLTSGAATTVGFACFGRVEMRQAAAITLAANCLGFVGIISLSLCGARCAPTPASSALLQQQACSTSSSSDATNAASVGVSLQVPQDVQMSETQNWPVQDTQKEWR